MIDREKVIKEAEEAIDILLKAEEPTFWLDFVRIAFENALSLLKAPEARVANLEELKLVTDNGPFYWMELRERKAFFPALKIEELGAGRAGPLAIQFAAIFNSGYGPVTVCRFKTEDYNIVWRCWTSRPTDEQRAVTPWSELPKEENG